MKKYIVVILFILIIGVFVTYILYKNDNSTVNTNINTDSSTVVQPTETININANTEPAKEKLVFTHDIFNVNEIKNITPLGELNGGYWESQSFAGVMINLKVDSNRDAEMIDIYSPIDMKLTSYSFSDMPGSNDPTWALVFELAPGVEMIMNHVQEAGEKITNVTTTVPVESSRTLEVMPPLEFEAGEFIAKTAGTPQAHNWNIYVYDESIENEFVRQERYLQDHFGERMITATCIFDYYPENIRKAYELLYGYGDAGQSNTCGTVVRDVKSSIAGLWYFSENPITGITEEKDGVYATPFAIYKTSDDTVIIHEINGQRYDIYPDNSSYKDPAEITNEHCYSLINITNKQPVGYTYFKVIDDYSMQVLFSDSSTCPGSFPIGNSKIYYR